MIFKKDVKEFIPITTTIVIDVKKSDYYKQMILESKDDKILCSIAKLNIGVASYYDVSAYRVTKAKAGKDIYSKLDYGALFKEDKKVKADKMYEDVIKEVTHDLKN